MVHVNGYTIKEKIYQGARFTIYRALRASDNQKVILKMCSADHPTLRDFFVLQYEYKILHDLKIPGVIRAYALEKNYNQMVLVLEDIGGMSLSQFLEKKRLSIDTFFKIAIPLVDVLAELHFHNVIHKDLNPKNIVIHPDTLALQIIDFSICSQMSQEILEMSAAKDLEGTLAYISPEQTGRTSHSIDYRADFYSLGITFYEMLTGRLPFAADDLLELMHCHLTVMPEAIHEVNEAVPPMLSEIVAKLLSKAPEDRYVSAVGLKADLLQCLEEWQQKHDIKKFVLGTKDVPDHLIISERLYGREAQVQQLLKTFQHIALGKKEILWISGYSGIGKTSLVKEIYKPITQKKGYFINGKFDQLQHGEPYVAFIEAFQKLVHRLLSESEHKLYQIKEALLRAFSGNGQVIIDVIPEMAFIIGPQDPVPILPPTETHNRFVAIFRNMVRTFATSEHPLVIFLDDLQWIDSASLNLVQALLTDNEISYFLLIGAYRDNEVNADHPIVYLQKKLKEAKIIQDYLILSPLKLTDISQLLANSLNCSPKKVRTFAQLILEKTLGNPFFIKEFLQQLVSEKLLLFSYENAQWQWDVVKIQALSVTENVVDLIILRIQKLCKKTQSTLELAACIGHTFGLKTLCLVSNQSLKEAANAILEATHAVFITPIEGNTRMLAAMMNEMDESMLANEEYRFTHDRIQQAAYQLIPETKKQRLHLQIGRLLLKEKDLMNLNEEIFSILDHFNYSLSLITDPSERKMLAEYNFLAGMKAKSSSAFEAAKAYFKSAWTLLDHKSSHLSYKIKKELATCQYLTGELGAAEEGYHKLLRKTKTTLDKLEIYRLNCQMLSTLSRHKEALQLGLEALSYSNIYIPKHPGKWHILWNVFLINHKNVAQLTDRAIQSAEKRAVIDLISQLFNNAYVDDQNMFVYLTCMNIRLSFKYGYSDSTPFACLVYAFVIMHSLNMYDKALEFVTLAERIQAQQPPNNFVAKNYFLLGGMIQPWRSSLSESMETLIKGYYAGRDVGDIVYSNYCNLFILFTGFMLKDSLVDVEKILQNVLNFIKDNAIHDFIKFAEFVRTMLDIFMKNNYRMENVRLEEQKILANKNNTEIAFFYSYVIKLCYLINDFEEAVKFGEKFAAYEQYTLGMIVQVEANFYYFLAKTVSSRNRRVKLSEPTQKILDRFRRWAKWCDINYKHYLLILEAETARLQNKKTKAFKLYNRALALAEAQNAISIIAVIHELIALLFMDLQLMDDARTHFVNACHAYQNWGANTKCFLLKKAYPDYFVNPVNLLETTSKHRTGSGLESVDVISLFKATQAISSEIQLDKLLEKLLILLLQNSGAERGVLLTKEKREWCVLAEGTVVSQLITLKNKDTINKRNDLPHSLLRYVERTNDTLLLHSERELEPYFSSDNYLAEVKPQSILVMPIAYQGELHYLLYLENRTTYNVFTNNHIRILQVLSAQAAISIENAILYHQATHDTLTGLGNRTYLYQVFNTIVEKYKNINNQYIALLFFDLDGFKQINDTYGHEVGDELLIFIADCLREYIHGQNLSVRLGGDEFVILLVNQTVEQVTEMAERLIKKFREEVVLGNYHLYFGISIGISLYPKDSMTVSELLRQADIALYRVKASGKGHFQFYAPDKILV